MRSRNIAASLALALAAAAAGWAGGSAEPPQRPAPEQAPQPEQTPQRAQPRKAALATEDPCLACHAASTPGLVESWRLSRHASAGAGCAACHTPAEADPSGAEHFGAAVTPVVSPQYCAACHPEQAA
jgi:hypothetical protein